MPVITTLVVLTVSHWLLVSLCLHVLTEALFHRSYFRMDLCQLILIPLPYRLCYLLILLLPKGAYMTHSFSLLEKLGEEVGTDLITAGLWWRSPLPTQPYYCELSWWSTLPTWSPVAPCRAKGLHTAWNMEVQAPHSASCHRGLRRLLVPHESGLPTQSLCWCG